MTNMIDFNHFNPLPIDGPCRVVFTWENAIATDSQTLTVDLENGDYSAIISQVRESGGVYLPTNRNTIGFYPWPPLHVEIDPV